MGRKKGSRYIKKRKQSIQEHAIWKVLSDPGKYIESMDMARCGRKEAKGSRYSRKEAKGSRYSRKEAKGSRYSRKAERAPGTIGRLKELQIQGRLKELQVQ